MRYRPTEQQVCKRLAFYIADHEKDINKKDVSKWIQDSAVSAYEQLPRDQQPYIDEIADNLVDTIGGNRHQFGLRSALELIAAISDYVEVG